ncbi:MAG: TrmO family methyltransferase, partial [Desulforhabdus sp.]|nr:TrmO family methyltransferase [Desulforhabdus sp.]
FLDDMTHGLFATRAPRRPNAIGFSVVRLIRLVDHCLYIEDVDIIDGTPLLDIKPYVPEFDVRQVERCGWLTDRAKNAGHTRADQRFK